MGGAKRKKRQGPSPARRQVFSSARYSGGGGGGGATEEEGPAGGGGQQQGGKRRRRRRFGSEAERRSEAAVANDLYEAEDVVAEEDRDRGDKRFDVRKENGGGICARSVVELRVTATDARLARSDVRCARVVNERTRWRASSR